MSTPNPGATGQQQHKWQGIWSALRFVLTYMVVMALVSHVMSRWDASGRTDGAPADRRESTSTLSKDPAALTQLFPLARPGELFDVVVRPDVPIFDPIEYKSLAFDADVLSRGHYEQTRPVDLRSCVATNCSVQALITWTMSGVTFNASAPIIRFYPEKEKEEKRFLFSESHKGEEGPATRRPRGYQAYFQPILTLSPIVDFSSPLPVTHHTFTPQIDDSNLYGPAVYVNNFWLLRSHLQELSAESAEGELNFTVVISPLHVWKAVLYSQYEKTMRQQEDMGLASSADTEETKRIFLETNPYFLALTAIVTLLHIVFEYLAFSNDVKFWRGRKDFKGLSLRSVAVNCYSQTIIFLFLLEGSETSWMIVLSSGLGVLLEYWKLTKTVRLIPVGGGHPETGAVVPTQNRRFRLWNYEVCFNESYDKRTSQHDGTAIRYLTYIMLPILLVYAVYSAIFHTHRSLYSYVIHTQVQFIYLFGFAMMTPQIFINYKTKSVGQLPWRSFVYKALNTVIDDLFAFIIKMPWLHRLACFRDDAVFVVLLYQRWIYPVDMTRVEDEEGGEAPAGTEEEEGKKER